MIETLLGALGVLVVLLIIVCVVTAIITKRSSKTSNLSFEKNIYWGKLANSDSSIENATKYLELTNSRYLKNNGENN